MLTHGLLFLISSKGSFICTDRIAHTTVVVIPVMEHWLEREITGSGMGMSVLMNSFTEWSQKTKQFHEGEDSRILESRGSTAHQC